MNTVSLRHYCILWLRSTYLHTYISCSFSSITLPSIQHLATQRHHDWVAGIPSDAPKTKEERRQQQPCGSGPAKFAQVKSNTSEADSWKMRRLSYDEQKKQPLKHYFTKGSFQQFL